MDPLLDRWLQRIEGKVDRLDSKVEGLDEKLDSHLNGHKVQEARTFYPRTIGAFLVTVGFTAALTTGIGKIFG